jgi:hypothetical protein
MQPRLATIALVPALLLTAPWLYAQDAAPPSTPETSGGSPFQRGWYAEQGIELPLPFGAGLNYVFMDRDIDVTDVSVTVLDRPPESISDRASFNVSNRTSLSMVRFDAWALPFLDLYVMAGETRSDTNLVTSFEIDRPLGEPIPVVIEQNQPVDGPLYGGGATVVAGQGAMFIMADANYCRSDLDAFDGILDAWFVSGRVGWNHTTSRLQLRAWAGVAYLDSRRVLTITTDLPNIGTAKVEVDQQPVNPTTLELGGSLGINRRWDLLLEVGSNFDDAFLTVFSGSYRF